VVPLAAPSVVGVVVDVAPAPWPDAPVVPGLPLEPAVPLLFQLCVPPWPLPVVPIELPSVVPLDVEPVAELPDASLEPEPIELHAATDSTIMLPMRMP
jgi:hypothetical protein